MTRLQWQALWRCFFLGRTAQRFSFLLAGLVSVGSAVVYPLRAIAATPASAMEQLHMGAALTSVALTPDEPTADLATPEEILEELNRVRTAPAEYAQWLAALRPYYQGAAFRFPGERGVRTVEGIAALEGAIAALQTQPPLPPLTLAPGLSQASQAHVTELIDYHRFTLTGRDGSTPLSRAARYGSLDGGRLVELLSQGFRSPEAMVAYLIIDDGDRTRRTQDLILNREIVSLGAGCGLDGNGTPLCVFDLATEYRTEHRAEHRTEDRTTHGRSDGRDGNSIGRDGRDGSSGGQPLVAAQSMNSVGQRPERSPASVAENDLRHGSLSSPDLSSPDLSSTELDTLAANLVAETNVLRANPAAYAEKLIRLRPYYQGNLVRLPGQPAVEVTEGVAALDEAIAALQNTPPLDELAYSLGMSQGAADHSADLGLHGRVGHYGSDDSDPFVRINRYGRWDHAPGNIAGENITYGPLSSAEWHMIQLIVDDNVPDRGHRQALLKPEYQWIGSACEPHLEYRIVCVMTYASDYQEKP